MSGLTQRKAVREETLAPGLAVTSTNSGWRASTGLDGVHVWSVWLKCEGKGADAGGRPGGRGTLGWEPVAPVTLEETALTFSRLALVVVQTSVPVSK